MDIKELIEKAVQLLKDARYSNSRIYTYRWLWSKGIIQQQRLNWSRMYWGKCQV